jgi:hypothetical protein
MHYGSFVFTSNVDGQFQRAGFDDDHIDSGPNLIIIATRNPVPAVKSPAFPPSAIERSIARQTSWVL